LVVPGFYVDGKVQEARDAVTGTNSRERLDVEGEGEREA
jgi:hypothetical protein